MKKLMERIRAVAEEKGLSVADFENLFGLEVGSVEGLTHSLSSDKIEHMLETYKDLSAEWLMRGTGAMHLDLSQAISSQEAQSDAFQIGSNSSLRDVTIHNGANDAQLEMIRKSYADMASIKDTQISQLMTIIEKLTDKQ